MDYLLLYTSSNGAQVWAHPSHQGKELAENLLIGRFLCDIIGESVQLLSASTEPGTKNPDAMVGDEIWEFKTNYAATGTSIDTVIREAHRQAANVLLYLTAPMSVSSLENAIYGRVRKCANLKLLRIVLAERLHEFSREDVMSQRFRGTIKGEGSPA